MFEDKAGTEVEDKQGKTDGKKKKVIINFLNFFFFFAKESLLAHFEKLTQQTFESRRRWGDSAAATVSVF